MAFYGYESSGCYEGKLYNYNLYGYSVNPSESYQVYFPSEPKFTIAYSTNSNGDADFQEYDPTPYDGGYDQAVTYGKPLPPSDLTCYPRSSPKSNTPLALDTTAPSPYAKDDPLPLPLPLPLPRLPAFQPSNENGRMAAEPSDSDCYWSYEHQNDYGSGLEAVDICETIFGHWPCLAKMNRHCQVCDQDAIIDPWEAAADYFFGPPLPYQV